MNKNQWLTVLEVNKLLQSNAEVVAFEHALEEIAKQSDPALLPELHLLLDDRCEQPEVLFGLVHFLESFEMSLQLSAFVIIAPQLLITASGWVKIMHSRILNDQESCVMYQTILKSINQSEPNFVRQLLEESLNYHLSDKSLEFESV
jgi:hypothetical protein